MTTADTDRRTMHFESVRFDSDGTGCDAWFFARPAPHSPPTQECRWW